MTVLRTRLLADRARSLGLDGMADAVESEWAACARLMRVKEDFEGTWSDELLAPLRRMLNHMIEEAAPLRWSAAAAASNTPLGVVEEAWKAFGQSANGYAQWEADAVKQIRTEIAAGEAFGVVP